MAFVMSWGFYVMQRSLQKWIPPRVVGSILIFLFILYCCGSTEIIKSDTSPDLRYSFTSEELDGFDYVSSYVPSGSFIYSDYYTSYYFYSPYFSQSDALKLPFYQSLIIRNVTDIPSHNGFVIIPSIQFLEHGIKFSKGNDINPEGGIYSYLPSKKTISDLFGNLACKDKIFSSEYVEIYHS
ncbi:hypothetical protein M0C91_13005 [Methanoculleus sp. 7T]|nr:hypothetical protein [Methanoculleus sp. 7T]